MTVNELIAAQRDMPPDAAVIVEDPGALPGPKVHRLGYGEVQRLEVGAWVSNGLCLFEVWRADGTMSRPYAAVLLGSLS